jgi:hypothetical protein
MRLINALNNVIHAIVPNIYTSTLYLCLLLNMPMLSYCSKETGGTMAIDFDFKKYAIKVK